MSHSGRGRFSLSEMPVEEIEIPAGAMMSRKQGVVSMPLPQNPPIAPEDPAPVAAGPSQMIEPPNPKTVEQGREESTHSKGRKGKPDASLDSLAEFAAREFPVEEARTKTSMSLPVSVNDRLEDEKTRMKRLGHKDVSRESIVAEALRQYFARIDAQLNRR